MSRDESRIVWCAEATERGTICVVPTRTSKASSNNRRFNCPACRKKGPNERDGDDDGSGGGSTSSTAASGGVRSKLAPDLPAVRQMILSSN